MAAMEASQPELRVAQCLLDAILMVRQCLFIDSNDVPSETHSERRIFEVTLGVG